LWPELEHDRVERLLDLIVEHKIRMAITRAVWQKIGTVWDPRHADHPQLRYAPSPLRSWWDRQYPSAMPDDLRLEWIRALAGMQIFTSRLIERGGRIMAGSDTPFVNLVPGFSLHDELQLLVECGMRPSQALDAATCYAAEGLGISHLVGTIESGKAADLLVIEGDPALDIRALARIKAVIVGGRWLDPKVLLAEASEQAAIARPRTQRRISELY
jgi:hypothetical protein